MNMDKDFYHVTNIKMDSYLLDTDKAIPRRTINDDYGTINDLLQELFANVRFGPPLTKKGKVGVLLLSEGYTGVYMQKKDRVITVRERFGEARVTLQQATSKLDGIIDKGVEDLGYRTL